MCPHMVRLSLFLLLNLNQLLHAIHVFDWATDLFVQLIDAAQVRYPLQLVFDIYLAAQVAETIIALVDLPLLFAFFTGL